MTTPHFHFQGTVPYLQKATRAMPKALGYAETSGAENFRGWQTRARRKLRELMGFLPAEVSSPRSWLIEREVVEGFTREHWALESPLGDHVFLYRLVPEQAAGRVMVALHGHGTYPNDAVAGVNLGRENEAYEIEFFNYDYGAECARRGYLVYVPCQRGFNQRGGPGNSCLDINSRATLLGSNDIGLRVQDVLGLLDWIKSRPEERRLPGGGHATQFVAALDTRVEVACNQGYFAYWRDQIVDVTHCNCNYVPGLLRWFEQPDVAALICPRPLLVTTATEDTVAPIASFRRAYRALKQIYRDQGVPERLEQDTFEGHHEWSGRKVYGFFEKWLGR